MGSSKVTTPQVWGVATPQNWGPVLPKSGEANKEAITNNVTTRSKAGAPTPDHLHPQQYANRILEVLGMPQSRQNTLIVAAAVEAEAKYSGRTFAAICEFLAAKAMGDR